MTQSEKTVLAMARLLRDILKELVEKGATPEIMNKQWGALSLLVDACRELTDEEPEEKKTP